MEDNTSSDDEICKTPQSPKSGGKKLKLNDGSSQDSLKGEVADSKDDNGDSGVSADKSESTSSDDRGASTSEGPMNEVIDVAPSTSNVRAILLNIIRPKRGRNYRKRKTPDRDSDSNDSSRDSDDLSDEENVVPTRPNDSGNDSNPESDGEDLHRLLYTFNSGDSHTGSNSSPGSHQTSSIDTYDMMMVGNDTDSDEDATWPQSNDEHEDDDDENKRKTPDVLLKAQPPHKYFILREIINREMGLTFPRGKVAKDNVTFERHFYGALHTVHRLKRLHRLNKHKGCVNSINFHPEGRLLASGSDDTNVVIWDWSRKQALQTIKTGHKSNVFQSKFLYLNARSQLNIVTCARDGQVRLIQCPSSGGGAVSRRRLTAHSRAAHKLHVCAAAPHDVLSAGEDGLVLHADVRTDHANKMFQVKERGDTIPLYSVCGHPLEPRQLLVAGRDKFLRVYDRRKSNKPIAMYCPKFQNTDSTKNTDQKQKFRMSMMHLTCAVYNHDGSEILGSYNDEDIYLFDARTDQYDSENSEKDGFTHRYSGHRNSATFKGVSFFGARSEFIVSGSDCSYIYMWEKKSEAIVQWMHGDDSGVVNCIEAHPRYPVLATSGLDKDVKIWTPHSDADPTYEGLSKVVKENAVSQIRSPLFNDFLPTLYNAWRGDNSSVFGNDDDSHSVHIDHEGNVCTTF